jgi:lipopolysaccharide export system protein LptA
VKAVNRRATIVLTILLAIVLTAGTARAEGFLSVGLGSNQPIQVTSKKSTGKNLPTGKELTFEGGVRVRQGQVTLTCDKLVVIFEEDKNGKDRAKKVPADLQVSGLRSMTASGNVKVVQNERMAVAGKALFDNLKRTITLTENPRLWQGPDVAIAHTIVVYLDENRSELQGKDGGEISVMINPGKHRKDTGNGRDKEKSKEK